MNKHIRADHVHGFEIITLTYRQFLLFSLQFIFYFLFFIFITLYFVVINENLFHAYHAYHPYIYMLNDSFNKVTMMRQFHKEFFMRRFHKDIFFSERCVICRCALILAFLGRQC